MASTLIFELSSQLGLQIIGVSHEDVIIEHANNFYEVSQHQGVSYVKNRN
jgi:chromosome segregation ATPase